MALGVLTVTDQEFAIAHAERCRQHTEHLAWLRTIPGRRWYANQLEFSPDYAPWREYSPRNIILARNYIQYFTFAELTHAERIARNPAYALRASTPIPKDLAARCKKALRGIAANAMQYGHAACTGDVAELAASHTGDCQLCGIAETELGRKHAADHDHLTGHFRGWLCYRCNTFIT